MGLVMQEYKSKFPKINLYYIINIPPRQPDTDDMALFEDII